MGCLGFVTLTASKLDDISKVRDTFFLLFSCFWLLFCFFRAGHKQCLDFHQQLNPCFSKAGKKHEKAKKKKKSRTLIKLSSVWDPPETKDGLLHQPPRKSVAQMLALSSQCHALQQSKMLQAAMMHTADGVHAAMAHTADGVHAPPSKLALWLGSAWCASCSYGRGGWTAPRRRSIRSL
jgi:hypothetical protein